MDKQEFTDKFFNAIKKHQCLTIAGWSGGNDSGSYEITSSYKDVLTKEFEPDIVQKIIDGTEELMHKVLNYGSFAGNFYSQGDATIKICDSLETSMVILEGEETDYEGTVHSEETFITPLTEDFARLDSIIIEDNNVYCYSIDGQVLRSDVEPILDFINNKDINIYYQEFTIDNSIVMIDEKPHLQLELLNVVNQEISIYNEISLTDLINEIWQMM